MTEIASAYRKVTEELNALNGINEPSRTRTAVANARRALCDLDQALIAAARSADVNPYPEGPAAA